MAERWLDGRITPQTPRTPQWRPPSALATTRAEPLGGRAPSGPRDERSAASVSTAAVSSSMRTGRTAVGVAVADACRAMWVTADRAELERHSRPCTPSCRAFRNPCAQRAEGSLRPGAYGSRCDRIAATSGGRAPSLRSSSCRKPTTSSINLAYAHGEEIIDGSFQPVCPQIGGSHVPGCTPTGHTSNATK